VIHRRDLLLRRPQEIHASVHVITHDTVALNDAIDAAAKQYARQNRQSELQYLRATQVMPGGNTRSVLFYTPRQL
jgi:glutamate-1-semialdehyde 2,1-aminomutase